MSTEERFFTITSELVESINEQFFLRDIDFDNKYCNILFYEIARLFFEKNKIDVLKETITNFISDCLIEVDIDGINDYTLFYDNINLLLNIDFIEEEDIEKLKNRLENKLVLNNEENSNNIVKAKQKTLLLTNIS